MMARNFMRVVDDDPINFTEINAEKVCFVIVKSRELLAEDEGLKADPSNASDDGEQSILTESAYAPVRAELAGFIDGLDEEEAAALVGLLWVGRGDFEREEWDDALKLARERRETPMLTYLLGEPLLPDYLEEGLQAFGLTCRGFEEEKSSRA
jgi:hypothetical protein